MNLLLLEPSELQSDGTATLAGRRAQHAAEVLKASPGDSLRVGVRDGLIGAGTILSSAKDELRLAVTLTDSPPPRSGIDLVLAIPRPKALKKVIPAVASLGVERVALVNAARVEKSYFDSKVLAPSFLAELTRLGLEQAKDTRAPTFEIHERFRPFVEDQLDDWCRTKDRFLIHPGEDRGIEAARAAGPRRVLAIGPEGGWVPFEVELLQAQGFMPVSLGPRILRVEVVVPYVLGALLSSALNERVD